MASLSLVGASLRTGMRWTADDLADELGDPGRPPILLYPGPTARDILREPPPGPVTLICVDGTWAQARSLVNRNPVLQALPRYAFAAPEPTHYRIRREPAAEYVSTIEALMHVLGVLERDPTRVRALLDPFHAMVDAQLAAQASAPRRTSYRRPRAVAPARPRLPAELGARFADLVCVVAESNAWPRGADESRTDELVHLALHRPSTGETFEAIAAPGGELAPSTAFHVGLAEAELRAGVPLARVLAAAARWLRPTDVACAWGHYALQLMLASGGAPPADQLDLRAAAQRLENRKVGSLEAYAAASELLARARIGDPGERAPSPLAAGRAGRRLALLAQVVHAWRALLERA